MQFSTPTSTPLYTSINRIYAQTPVVFEIVHDEIVKVIYTSHVQRKCSAESSCVGSCVTKEFSISPRFSPTNFDPDANSVLLRAHLCTAVDSTRRKPCVRNCSREREDLYNGNVHLSPVLAYDFYCDANSVLLLALLCTAVVMGSMRRTLCSKLFVMRA